MAEFEGKRKEEKTAGNCFGSDGCDCPPLKE
jgi:hypothetical protein